MKKFFVVALASLFVCSAVDAQILRADELESYVLKTEDIHPPKTGISVHFSGSLV
jgi:hypothetical protein